MFIKNWQDKWKSLAVILPTLATIIVTVLQMGVDVNIIPTQYLPFVVLVTGYLGRIVQQKNLKE